MTLTFDRTAYGDLLLEVTPKVIESESEYEQTPVAVEALTVNQNRTPEETTLYKLLVMLVEAYSVSHSSEVQIETRSSCMIGVSDFLLYFIRLERAV